MSSGHRPGSQPARAPTWLPRPWLRATVTRHRPHARSYVANRQSLQCRTDEIPAITGPNDPHRFAIGRPAGRLETAFRGGLRAVSARPGHPFSLSISKAPTMVMKSTCLRARSGRGRAAVAAALMARLAHAQSPYVKAEIPQSDRVAGSSQVPTPDTNKANQHFREGVAAFQRGEADLAVREFESAFEASPHHAVLYNLGLAYAAVGRPVEAVDALSHYLEEGGASITLDRRRRVADALGLYQKRIGEVVLTVAPSPEMSEVSVDGRSVAPAMLATPIRLATGIHGIVVQAPTMSTEARSVTIVAGQRQQLQITLVRQPFASLAGPATAGALRIACEVPDVLVQIDGVPQSAKEPSHFQLLSPGPHRLTFLRDGFERDERHVQLVPEKVQEVTCQMRIRRDLPANRTARLLVQGSLANARLLLDGMGYGGEPVPAGRHRLVVSCDGCDPWLEELVLTAGETRSISLNSRLLSEGARRLEAQKSQRRTWAWIAGGTGLALGATAAVLAAVQHQEKNDWIADGESLKQQLASGDRSDSVMNATLDHQHQALAIQQTGVAAMATALVGAALLSAAAYLYWGEPSVGLSRAPGATTGRAATQWPIPWW